MNIRTYHQIKPISLLLLFSIILFLNLCSGVINAKEIALSFDDSPRAANGFFDGKTRAKKLIENLKSRNIKQAAFFSVSKRLDAKGIQRLKSYSDAGHIIANHTHSHGDYNALTFDQFSGDFLRAHKHLKEFDNFKKMFRFPYLREGNTLNKRDKMRALLKQKGYINAYVTANNYDWYIEALFQKAIKNNRSIDFVSLKNFYVDIMIQGIEYYDQMAINHLDRSPKHVLLLHEMDITALFIGDLIDELRIRGWKIIPIKEAYEDPIAQFEIPVPLKFNPGRIGEIAKQNQQKSGLWHFTLDESYLSKMFNQKVLNDIK